MNKLLAAVATALFFQVSASAAEPARETVFEIHSDAITLPAKVGDYVVIKTCETCPTRTFRTSAKAQFIVDDVEVGLEGLRAHFKLYPRTLTAVGLSLDHSELIEINAITPRHSTPN